MIKKFFCNFNFFLNSVWFLKVSIDLSILLKTCNWTHWVFQPSAELNTPNFMRALSVNSICSKRFVCSSVRSEHGRLKPLYYRMPSVDHITMKFKSIIAQLLLKFWDVLLKKSRRDVIFFSNAVFLIREKRRLI